MSQQEEELEVFYTSIHLSEHHLYSSSSKCLRRHEINQSRLWLRDTVMNQENVRIIIHFTSNTSDYRWLESNHFLFPANYKLLSVCLRPCLEDTRVPVVSLWGSWIWMLSTVVFHLPQGHRHLVQSDSSGSWICKVMPHCQTEIGQCPLLGDSGSNHTRIRLSHTAFCPRREDHQSERLYQDSSWSNFYFALFLYAFQKQQNHRWCLCP